RFIGPVIGAAVLTWLQASLSGYTSAWLFYLGLFFMAIIVFAPAGLAGLILMHRPIIRMPAFWRVLRAYAIAFTPALVMTNGALVIIEMSYRLSTQPELGTRMRLFWTDIDAATPWPWLAAVVMIVSGFVVFRKTWRIVAQAWQQ